MDIKIHSLQNVSVFRVDFHSASLSHVFLMHIQICLSAFWFCFTSAYSKRNLVVFSPEFDIKQNRREEAKNEEENK